MSGLRRETVHIKDCNGREPKGRRKLRERFAGNCDYCGEPLAGREPGYVAAYDAVVCRECYEDHHGDI